VARPRFDPNASHTAARSFTYNGVEYGAGDPFPSGDFAAHRMRTLYDSRALNQGDAGSTDPVQLRQTRPGYFEITAPWLDEPEKVRGKANADKRLAELRDAGEPLDHHGVAVEGDGEGGWYEVTAEWLDEPVKVQGLDEAKAEAARLRSAGPPPEHYALVTVMPVDPDQPEGAQTVDAPWLDNIETLDDLEQANARAQVIREAGPPAEGYDADAIQKAREERAAADAEQAEKAQAEADETARKAAYSDAFEVSSITVNDVTTYSLTGPGLDEPVTFEGETAEADANARLTELRDAGPPEGWTAPTE
jgi:hypothetical protein